MKKGILFLLLVISVLADAQSLKETLYGGKLKNEPGTVIRKGDDLTSKMDTGRKTPAIDSGKTKVAFLTDSSAKRLTQTDSAILSNDNKNNVSGSTDSSSLGVDIIASKENTSASKDNTVLWKEYIDAVTGTLKTEVLSSKKIKKGTYYVSVSYAIGTDGQVAINNVLVTPENAFLQHQIKDRLAVDVPRLNPVLSGSGTPRKANKNYNFALSKE